MATVKFAYLDKCAAADPHVRFGVMVNGTQRMTITDNLSAFTTEEPDREDYETVARVLIQAFMRADKKAYPAATLAQRRARLEAMEWVI